MYFKVTSQQLKKSLLHLKTLEVEKQQFIEKFKAEKPKEFEVSKAKNQLDRIQTLISEISFAVYKTKVKEFFLGYEEAKLIRPALLQEDTI